MATTLEAAAAEAAAAGVVIAEEPQETMTVLVEDDSHAVVVEHHQEPETHIIVTEQEPMDTGGGGGDTGAQNAIQAQPSHSIKQERMDDRELAENLAQYINLTAQLDTETVLSVVSPKLLDHYTIWDIMLHKAKLTADIGALDTVLNDTSAVLSELKLLIECCLRPVKTRKGDDEEGKQRRRRKRMDNAIDLDDMLAVAMCLDAGVWKKRDSYEIDYYTPMINVESLFPERSDSGPRGPGRPRGSLSGPRKPKVKVKTEDAGDKDKDEAAEDDHIVDDGAKEPADDDPDFQAPKAEEKKEKRKRGRPRKIKIEEGEEETVDENGVVIKKEKVKVEISGNLQLLGDTYLCLKCGQTLCKAYGKQHEAKCDGMYVRHPEYKKVNDEYFCTVDGCDVGYSFTSIYGLRQHFHASHIREEEKYFACDYCDEKFSFKTSRNKHVKAKHLKAFVCDICGKGFGGKDKLQSHRYTHTGEKPYACDKCEYRAAKKYNLEMHLQSKHNDFGQKNYLCAICNKQFCTMGRVRRHMAVIHADGKESSGKKKRNRPLPLPPHLQQQQAEEAAAAAEAAATQEVAVQQEQQVQVIQQVEEQTATVQYLQSSMEESPHETVITVTPMYQ